MADRNAQYTPGGLVEMDDAFFGQRKPGKRGKGADGKAKVAVTVENRLGRPAFAALRQLKEPMAKKYRKRSARRQENEPQGTKEELNCLFGT